MAKKAESYNEAIDKLRRIVADIERGDLDVDCLLDNVKEATRLIKLCVWVEIYPSSSFQWQENQCLCIPLRSFGCGTIR